MQSTGFLQAPITMPESQCRYSRLRRKNFRAAVQVTTGLRPILLHMGFSIFEATVAEADAFHTSLADAIEQAKRARSNGHESSSGEL
jgi:hypothetical protein